MIGSYDYVIQAIVTGGNRLGEDRVGVSSSGVRTNSDVVGEGGLEGAVAVGRAVRTFVCSSQSQGHRLTLDCPSPSPPAA